MRSGNHWAAPPFLFCRPFWLVNIAREGLVWVVNIIISISLRCLFIFMVVMPDSIWLSWFYAVFIKIINSGWYWYMSWIYVVFFLSGFFSRSDSCLLRMDMLHFCICFSLDEQSLINNASLTWWLLHVTGKYILY